MLFGLKRAQKGFTIIELIVVIAVIGVLAAIVSSTVNIYISKAKIARAMEDVQSVEKALNIFYSEYGDYPDSTDGQGACEEGLCHSVVFSGGEFLHETPDPYLIVEGVNHPFSEVYKTDWHGLNADFFAKRAYYQVFIRYNSATNKFVYAWVEIRDEDGHFYGRQYILCTVPGAACGTSIPFNTTPVY